MEDIEHLKTFLNNNKELDELENMIDEFNIFSSLNFIRQELKHSDFLAWLFNPKETHGFGDYFLKLFVKRLLLYSPETYNTSLSIFTIDGYDFDDAEVSREYNNIDLLIISTKNNFLLSIENKVYSEEHSNQLQRYKNIVQSNFSHIGNKLFAYLNIEGNESTNSDYASVSYSEVIELLEYLLDNKKSKISSEIELFISHYIKMLRRYIVNDSEISKICQTIYKNHKKALDLIFEYKPDIYTDMSEIFIELIKKDSDLILDDSGKTNIRFFPKEMDYIPKKGDLWTTSKRIVLFEIKNYGKEISVYLLVGRGDQNLRKYLVEIAKKDNVLFKESKRTMTDKWFTIHKRQLVKLSDLEDKDKSEIKDILAEKLNKYKETELKKVVEHFKEYFDKTKSF